MENSGMLRGLTAVAMRLLAFGLPLAAAAGAAGQQFVDQTATRFPVPNPSEYTNQLTIGDIDNDGDLDLIFANGQGFSSQGAALPQRVYINNGAGVFTDESTARLNVNGWARGVELGDIDGDGDEDMIIAQDFEKFPLLYENDGNGFFTSITAQLPAIALSSSRAQFGDIDNDGDLDIYITSGTGNRFGCDQYRVYVNDGAGNFVDETATRHPIGSVCSNMDCIFGDIDNDFDLDVRTGSTGTNNSRLYRNNGMGVFTLVAGVPADSSCYSYDFGDIDGDGDLDLIGANGLSGSNAEILLANNGAGVYSNVSGQISPNPSQDDNDSKFLDWDNDGDLDLLIARLGGGEKSYLNNGAGFFTQVTNVIQSITDSSLDIKVADLNNDGRYDVVTAQGESGSYQNRIYINNGPVDTLAPVIIDTEQLGDTKSTGPFVVRALILDDHTSDRNFFDKGIFLNYTVGAGPVQQAPMKHSGGQVYRGVIESVTPGLVEYWVTAIDWANNEGAGDVLSFTVSGGSVPGDATGDGIVNVEDMVAVILGWGPCPGCDADLNGDGEITVEDLVEVILNWTA
jgi:hypothetical protein